jgi:hypothetical protein
VWGLGGFDGSGGEAVLAGGDLDPDVDGGDLTLAVAELGFLGAWDGGKTREDVVPGVFVYGPGFEGSASMPVVDQLGGGLVEFAGEGVECGFEGVGGRCASWRCGERGLRRSRSGPCVRGWCRWRRCRDGRRLRRVSRPRPFGPVGAVRCVNMGLTPPSGSKWRSYQSSARNAGMCSGPQSRGRRVALRRAWGWPPDLVNVRRSRAEAVVRPGEHGVVVRETRRPQEDRLALRVLVGSKARRCSMRLAQTWCSTRCRMYSSGWIRAMCTAVATRSWRPAG